MAQQPPRTNTSRSGGGGGSSGSSGGRAQDKSQHETFFLGRYRVVDEIGVGGMASVHLARMDGPGGFQKWVAIKRIHPHLVEDDQFVDMFLDEARIAAGINHANVAQVFDLGKDDNTYWIAMEYLHGEPLREVMRRCEERQHLISAELASRICADAAEGLHAAHELRGKNGQLLGLVHRDVTPHNLFCTYDGYTKVVDFGIAKVADRLASTRAGTLKGKLAYMSPEQVRGAEVDRTTDIFALGVVLWELTTGHRLFRMDTDLDTLEKVQACIVPPPSTLVPDYPVELESIVMKALSKRKDDRYPTAREFSRALQGFLMRRGVMIGPEEVAIFTREVFADRIQKREAHLAWASEVTSTVDIANIQLPGRGPLTSDQSIHSRSVGSRGSESAMSAGSMASTAAPLPAVGRGAPPPRVAPPPPPSSPNIPAGMSRPSGAPGRPGSEAPRPPTHGGLAGASLTDEEEDIPTTIAMRDDASQQMILRKPVGGRTTVPQGRPNGGPIGPSPGSQGHPQQGMGGGGQGGMPSAPSFSPAPTFGPNPTGQHAAVGNGAAPPMFGMPPPSAAHPQGGQQQPHPHGQQGSNAPPQPMGVPNLRQAAIETVLSMPRPDAAALWMAKQDVARRAGRQSLAVLVALAVLTAVCVAGLATLLYLKLVAPPPIAADDSSSVIPTAAAATNAPRPAGSAKPSSTVNATAAGASAKPGAAEPGYLTVICNPFCDDVRRGNESLGPSPIVKSPLPPGAHKITLSRAGGPSKVIDVTITAGEVHKETITMK